MRLGGSSNGDQHIDAHVEDIVQEANVSRGSFYTYFPSKLDAFQALTSEMGDQIDQLSRIGPTLRM